MHQEGHAETAAKEALLVQRAIGRDARLYDMHVNRVYRNIYYRVGNKADAEDLTQQVFLKAWQAIGRYKKTASPFVAWLITISHNLVIDFYRTRKSESYLDMDFIAHDPTPGPKSTAEASFEQQRLGVIPPKPPIPEGVPAPKEIPPVPRPDVPADSDRETEVEED